MAMNPLKALTRLFARTENPVVAQLYTHAIGQPLMVHPSIGQNLVTAYMSGAVAHRPALVELQTPVAGDVGLLDDPGSLPATIETAVVTKRIGIVNISGALVSRPMPGPCGDAGPVSYEEIRTAFDALLADQDVVAIVIRADSPGGMVSGCFDLVDHIQSSRGTKPIITVVDDMAYSAMFAIASASDEIWVSRTGGTGSVGVVGYHVDWSQANAKEGIKITAIYAGAHKIDFSPDYPLTDEAKADSQARIDTLYTMFVDTVARNRGISADDVRATEAGIFIGQSALDAGFATHLGTLRDALASLSERMAVAAEFPAAPATDIDDDDDDMASAVTELAATAPPTDTNAVADAAPLAAPPTPESLAAALTAAAFASKLPQPVQVALIKRGPQGQTPDEAIAYASRIRDICAAAQLESCTDDYVRANTPIETVRADLLATRANDGPEVVTSIPKAADQSGHAKSGSLVSRSDYIFSQRAAAARAASHPRQ